MDCHEFEDRWHQLLDDRQSPEHDSELVEHAASCSECAEMLDVQAALFDTLDWRVPVAPQVFVAELVATQPKRATKRPIRLAAGALLSAACLVVLASYFQIGSLPSRQSDTRHTEPQQVAVDASPSITVAAVTPASSKTNEAQIRELVQNIADRIPEVPADKLEPIDRISDGFRPVANTLGGALGAMRRSIPMGRQPKSSEPSASRFDDAAARFA